jgi:type IV pilus assembly protein PilY1
MNGGENNMKKHARRKLAPGLALAGLSLLVAMSPARAEDVDLFLKNPLTDAARPNLLLIVDNAANNNSNITPLPNGSGSSKLDVIKDVLNILTQPLTSKYFPTCTVPADPKKPRVPEDCHTPAEVDAMVKNINIGLMLMNPSGAGSGAFVRSHIRPMNVDANRTKLWDTIKDGIPSANNAEYALAMHEAYLYFGAKDARAGFNSKAPYDPEAKNTTTGKYRSPIGDVCQPNYIIFIGNGGPASQEDKEALPLLTGLGGVLTSDPIKFSPSNYQSNWMDEYARTLNRADLSTALAGDQVATTYTIAIQNPADNNFNTAPNESSRLLLQSAALAGGGQYALGENGQAVLNAVLAALRKMQPVNSVFAAVTLPVSVNVRGTFLNQVYMGQFRPDANARPRWPGNLKQYQIGLNANDDPILVDRNKKAVEDTAKGFLLPDITSFWSQSSDYWKFTTAGANDAPDGAIVEKGGAAQRMRADLADATKRGNRKLYTCNGDCVKGAALSTVNFATSNSNTAGPSIANLGVADATARTALIEWVRGADNKEDENQDTASTDSRAYIHGDLLHSRPAVVNYNRTAGDRDVVVYYGSNDGIFRAVKGGQDDADGWEKWGMVFPEFFSRLKRLRDNDDVIEPAAPKPYFADGAVSVYQYDANGDGKLVAADGDKVYLYIGMRRGGRLIYALDVSDPENPKFMWKVDENTLHTDGTKPFANLGQTWSTIRPATIKANANPVVMFGGGYDPVGEDPQPAVANTMGQGIYVLDAVDGKFLKRIAPTGMGAIPADLTFLDRNTDGKVDRIYAPDTKGNVWRLDIDDASMDNWASWKIASFGGTGADGRKFLNKVDVVLGKTFDALLVGSGDREHPFETTVVDRFYMLQDPFVGLAGGLFCGSTTTKTTCTHSDLTDVTSNAYQNSSLPTGTHGWYLSFAAGEKLVSNPITVFGTLIFGTNKPTPSTDGQTCGNLGEARLYQLDFRTAGAVQDTNGDGVVDAKDRSAVVAGGGYLPSAVYSPVMIDGKRRDVVCVGTRCFKPGGAKYDTRRHRTYWFKQQ